MAFTAIDAISTTPVARVWGDPPPIDTFAMFPESVVVPQYKLVESTAIAEARGCPEATTTGCPSAPPPASEMLLPPLEEPALLPDAEPPDPELLPSPVPELGAPSLPPASLWLPGEDPVQATRPPTG